MERKEKEWFAAMQVLFQIIDHKNTEAPGSYFHIECFCLLGAVLITIQAQSVYSVLKSVHEVRGFCF